MENKESLQDFYKNKNFPMPDNINSGVGHFNIFELKPRPIGTKVKLPYQRRDYYKVMLIQGDIVMHYANRSVQIEKQALVFSNPQIPYQCQGLERMNGHAYCIFNHSFFKNFGHIEKYEIYQPKGNKVFELNDKQYQEVKSIFEIIQSEFHSEYIHKFDAIKNRIFELLHFAMKLNPSSKEPKSHMNASQRITNVFLELLERQFPINQNQIQISLRSATDFANQLNIHVNHLNRALKEVTNKSTTELVAERIQTEAKNLLKNSHMAINDISFALGFSEPSHFSNFFKKRTGLTPGKFRKSN